MLSFEALSGTTPSARSEQDSPGYPQAKKYLAARGIDEQRTEDLHLSIFPARELWNKVYSSNRSQDDRMAIVFPHYTFGGQLIEWWSARLVDTELRIVKSFADLVKKGKSKMTCPPDVPPHAYLPPVLHWKELKKGDRVYIHESCIKAANGAFLGRWSIGLNGVWGWKSKKHDIRLLSELRDFPWKKLELEPVIVFDSNAVDNWDVQNAIVQLAATLFDITGRRARHILLPKHEDDHQGFDDFCVRNPREVVEAYLDQEGEEVEISEVQQVKAQLNQEVVVVRALGRIAEQATGTLMSKQVFTDINYGHYNVLVEDGDNVKPINVPKLWLSDSRRSEVERIDYIPGGARISSGALNLWRGLGVEPRSGDVGPFLALLENNIPDEGLRRWLLQWLAYPLQQLGGKTTTFVHLFGPSGTGKNMLVRPLLRIYGPNGVTIGKEQIESSFNSIYGAKQLIHLDELHGGNQETARKISNKIKMLVTGEHLVINQKGQPEYEIRNHANLITTSNYYDSIKLDDDDRRAAVIKFQPAHDVRHDQAYWQRYVAWCDEDGGAESLLDYLLKLDIANFNPRAWAPETKEKQQVKEATKSGVEDWVEMLEEDPDGVIPMIFQGRCLFTTKELAIVFYGDADPAQGQIVSLGRALTNKGFEKADNGQLIKVKGNVQRYWVIKKRSENWTREKCIDHLKLY